MKNNIFGYLFSIVIIIIMAFAIYKVTSNNNQEEIDSIVEDLKDTFARTSLKIDKLSMKNTDIESVLDTISGKIDELLSSSTKAAELSVDDIDISEKNNTDDQFDFIQAFDLLQQDIIFEDGFISQSI